MENTSIVICIGRLLFLVPVSVYAAVIAQHHFFFC